MASAESGDRISVTVVVSPAAGVVQQVDLQLPAGAMLRDALLRSGLWTQAESLGEPVPQTGVWGRLRPLDHVLRDRDRVEVYRPLQRDPKDARRLRHRQQRRRPR